MSDFNLVDANGAVLVRDFANAGLAGRYAKKHGLTVAKNVGALALIETVDLDATDLDASDVDAVLTDLDADTVQNVETVAPQSFRDIALSFDDATVMRMVASIGDSFDRRDAFEESQGLNIAVDNSYSRERDRMTRNGIAVARFFLALGIEASDVIERKVSSTAMFNAKALKKVTELAQYSCGIGQRIERVTRAFLCCALIATDRGVSVITNDTNRKFLCSVNFSGQIADQDLIDHLDELRHRAMTSGAETQSSQARNVLDVLGLGSIMSVHKNRDAIKLNRDAPFFADFARDFLK